MTSFFAMLFMLPFMLLGAALGLVSVALQSGYMSMVNYLGITALRKRKKIEFLKAVKKMMEEPD